MSYLKYITSKSTVIDEEWLLNPELAYKHLTPKEKALFLLDQAIMLNYIERLCGGENKLPVLYAQYKNHLITWCYPDIDKEAIAEGVDFRVVNTNVACLLGKNPGKVYADECMSILATRSENSTAPAACVPSFYEPYLRFVERTYGLSNYIESEQISKNRSFSIGSSVSIPYFKIIRRSVIVSYEGDLPSYNFDYTKTAKYFADEGIDISSIFSFWSGYNWSGKTFNSVIGVLAAMSLEKDLNAIPTGSWLLAYYLVYKQVIAGVTLNPNNSLALSSANTFKRYITLFLVYLRKQYNVLFDDPELLSRFTADLNKSDATLLNSFLQAKDPAKVSVEMYNAFKQSYFGDFSELDLLNGRNGRANQSGYMNAKNTAGDDPDATEEPSGSQKKKSGDSDSDLLDINKLFDSAPSISDDEDSQKKESKKPKKKVSQKKKADTLDRMFDEMPEAEQDEEQPDTEDTGDADQITALFDEDPTKNEDDDQKDTTSSTDQILDELDSPPEDDSKGGNSNDGDNKDIDDMFDEDPTKSDSESSNVDDISAELDKAPTADGDESSNLNEDTVKKLEATINEMPGDDTGGQNTSSDKDQDPKSQNDTNSTDPKVKAKYEDQDTATHTKGLKLDDPGGVKLSMSEGETTSTVLYREELEAYIDSLLANPPSSLSVQTISAIKRLKAYWFYLLPVDQLHDFLRAMVKIPKSITIKK